MSKYIETEKIPWTDLNDGRGGVNVYVTFLEKVARMPAADVQEVKHGRWKSFDLTWGRSIYACTSCGEALEVPTECGKPMYEFCPYCGARMGNEDE